MATTPEPAATAETATILEAAAALCSGAAASWRSGLPALSVPAGVDRDGLPIGLQIAAAPFDEETALRVGACFEAAAGIRGRRPPIHASG